ncbi:BZ3500_MvSof-1268-A1-R1_Chr1-3g02004 [Microbotryum saponariae]|uniref:BZ3500_MvSof-1268-A1-R1_Chr1-3g02004 protein n=1 Tax=Microbotryum saponariae TaxID=289078 RepID=A0A2X0KVX6_9BASI|nr:BZ3500_MvSof-1268-A1-R1_Chr1-3g02004 [Microbotryum saponariae]SCZ95149.1 BZ3501_MvSof-1269-A2-R1_Chr1-3g01606 [Microbotryum saponariae]
MDPRLTQRSSFSSSNFSASTNRSSRGSRSSLASSSAASYDTDGTSPDSSPRFLKSPIPTTSQSHSNGHHKRTSVQSLPAGRGNGSFVDTAAPTVSSASGSAARDDLGSTRRASAPPNPLKSVSLSPRRGRPMLEPRGPKMQSQFLGLDLSFLEDEPPPPPPGSSSVRPSWAVARRANSGASGRSTSDEFGPSQRPSITLPTQRASVGSIGLTFPSASRPFPSRKPPPLSDLRSTSSSNKKTSPSAVSLNTFGRLGPATSPPCPSRTASSSSESEDDRLPLSNSQLSTVEQRTNLAVYLDEAAEAMEGGKSLAMAHEELRTSNGSRRPSRDFQAAFEAQEAQKVAEQQNKRAEKRRRTIKELCDTERVYASDLAVLRDIFLTRARGAEMSPIVDHVMASGLGLVRLGEDEEESPSSNAKWARTPRSRQTSFTRSSVLAKLERRRQDSTGQALEYIEDAVMSSRDIYTIFINLEEIAQLAERFSAALDAAQGIDSEDAQDDRIGEVFVDTLPRIKQVYSTYCARHHRAIIRLQELEPTLRTYFSECRTLSHGRTSAWDLASLLIKPVQRCLKYPLLLEQILAVTPTDHPDRPSLVAALKMMLLTAEHINDYKKRTDKVENVLASKRGSHSHSRDTSFSLHKKLLRSAAKSKATGNITDQNELFDTLAALVDTTRAGVLRFSAEMKDWSRVTKGALEAQVTMVSGWIDLCAPIGDEMYPHPSHRRLEVFLDDVLVPLIEGPFRELDHEIRRSLVSKTDHLLSLFENPLQVIKRRNEHKAEHRRYMTRKMPQDQRGSEDFVTLTTQLLEELPKFLASVSKYFNIVVSAFTNVQHIYQDSVRERWEAYADEWLTQIPKGDYAAIEAAFQDASRDVTQMLASIVKGLNLSVATAGTIQRRSKSTRRNQGRDSLHSTSSSSSNTTPVMSARGRFNGAEAKHFEDYSITSSFQGRSSGHGDNGSMPSSPSTGRPCLRRHEASSSLRRNKRASEALPPLPPMPTTSSSLISNYFDNVSEDEDHDGKDGDSMHHILYRAEAIASACSSAYRSGYPLLTFIEGDQVDVELEEADSEQGGSGWLLARDGEGILGWCRTEDFIVVE